MGSPYSPRTHVAHIALVLLALSGFVVLAGAGCGKNGDQVVSNSTPPAATEPAFEGDYLGSDKAGDRSLEIKSPDGRWIAYNVKQSDYGSDYALVVEGPDSFNRQIAIGSPWPESFSPDSRLLLFVDEAAIGAGRSANSLFVVHLPSGTIEQVTNTAPSLGTLPSESYAKAYVATPMAGVSWNGHVISYRTKSGLGALETIVIDLDADTISRIPGAGQ